jgi:DNA-binding transcriptional MerR regulator
MLIADAAAQIGVPAHRLRHYEATSLLVPSRSHAGYRDYSDADVARRGCPVTTARLTRRLEVISERRAQLEATERALQAWLSDTAA